MTSLPFHAESNRIALLKTLRLASLYCHLTASVLAHKATNPWLITTLLYLRVLEGDHLKRVWVPI